MTMRIISILIVLVLSTTAWAQTINPSIDIDFNNCVLEDIGAENVVLATGGSPICDCGVEGDALNFDGIDDYMEIESEVSSVFSRDFTLSFYVRIDNNPNLSGTVDLISLQKDCKRDSSFTLKYIPSIRECRLDIVKNLSRSTQINFKLDEGKCWQQIVVVRDRFDYLVYLNGRLAGQEAAATDYTFSPYATFAVSNSPCIGISDTRLQGAVEQLKVFNEALNELEIADLNLYPDVIMSNDTTLLLGESLQIEMGPSCANSFSWTNVADLDDAGSLTPIITPALSNTYYIYFNNGVCTSFDSIQIFIQDPNALNCDQLLLPNAFTPNKDNLNERFEISNKFIVDELISFDVYSRLGTRVFHGDSKQSSWDGSYQGTLLNPAKYAYIIEYVCAGNQYQKRGVVTLIR